MLRLDSLSLITIAIAFEKSLSEVEAAAERLAEVAERNTKVFGELRDVMTLDDPFAPPVEQDIRRMLECKVPQVDLDKVEEVLRSNRDIGTWSPDKAIKLARKNRRRGRK